MFKTVICVIPDNKQAEDALNESVLKIMKAHKAQGNHLFHSVPTPLPDLTGKEEKKEEKKPRKRRTKEEMEADEQEKATQASKE